MSMRIAPRATFPSWVICGSFALSCQFLLSACAPVEPALELPARWIEILREDTLIELDIHGTGWVENLPTPGKGECGLENSIQYTGNVEWRPLDEGSVYLELQKGQAILWADVQAFGSLEWGKVVYGICGVDTQIDELITLGGGPYREEQMGA
jgi:hypothetical protein